ncbi:glycosyltransferase family 2 protein [Christiangramia sabulilitoris]|uniref:glycosyltransferase family 2 protein n=1 Tax=Christiangramia sabulilitoris TaxID=2583991 RepID=UPI0014096190|nr:glycosyltransferase family 2 protein [Christiangramia sabulilitoris]
MDRLVSIIIPTFNRAHLIDKTLDSIIAQSYRRWECIVVDDTSTDHTIDVLKKYKDERRIKYLLRPLNLLKGANSCRNFGFKKSKGDYIIWFDSDDLMTPDHIECKLKTLIEYNVDFVISKTRNFKDGKLLEPYKYVVMDYGIKARDFILSKIHWYTYDVMLTREVAENISWNPVLESWQDHNYFSKMLLKTENGLHIDRILTQRRIHENSIQSRLTETETTFSKGILNYRIVNFTDIGDKVDKYVQKEMIFDMMNHSFRLASMRKRSEDIKAVKFLVLKKLGKQSLYYFNLSLIIAFLSKRGYFLLEKAKQRNMLSPQ